MDRIKILDTTLRDGEQAAGGKINVQEKLDIARQLERLGVDVIEVGQIDASKAPSDDFEAAKLIAKEVRTPIINVLAAATPENIDREWEAVKEAKHPRIKAILPVSDMLRDLMLNMSREEYLETARAMTARAKQYTDDVEFSLWDASRAEPEYIYHVAEAVIDAGATTLNISDSVGCAIPTEWGSLVKGILQNVPNINQAILSVHCHNDLGLAVANALESVRQGARQVECTVNGIGERTGNVPLEEIVMAIKIRQDFFNLTTNINTEQIYKTSQLVSELMHFPLGPGKSIVGVNAFQHSPVHQEESASIGNPMTFQIIDPRSIGR
ncbi:hypothetical protein ACFLUE_03075 [Chloroflexota bacterium]